MGLIRALLALSVVIGHSPWSGAQSQMGGRNAVQLFYITSGFLIAHVLCFGRNYSSNRSFYLNRWLRIAPTYYLIATLTFAIYAALNSEYFELLKKIPTAAALLLAITNLTIVGQDWIMFLGVSDGTLAFTKNYHDSDALLYQGLLIQPAWTLGLEFSFYILAPYIIKNPKLLFGTFATSIGIRAYLLMHGLALRDPWTYRFFPAELSLFLSGSISRIYIVPLIQKIIQSNTKKCNIGHILKWIMVGFIAGYSILPGSVLAKSLAALLLFLTALPFIYIAKDSKAELYLGELSYPIYVCHSLTIWLLNYLIYSKTQTSAGAQTVMNIFFSLLLAAILKSTLIDWIEHARTAIKQRSVA